MPSPGFTYDKLSDRLARRMAKASFQRTVYLLELFEMLILFISMQQHDESHFQIVSLKLTLASFVHFRNYILKIYVILRSSFDYPIRSQSIAGFQPDQMEVDRPRTIRMFRNLQNYSFFILKKGLPIMKTITETNLNVFDAMRCFMSVNWILVWKCKKPRKL